MAKNRSRNRRQGHQLRAIYSYGDCIVRDLRELDAAMNQRSRHRVEAEQSMLEANMHTLLRHLESGEVYYMTEMAVPSAFVNKELSTLMTFKTLYNDTECLWVVRHEPKESHLWVVDYTCKGNAFGAFRICSCDRVTPVR